MFGRTRLNCYASILGEDVAKAFVAFEQRCDKESWDPNLTRRILQWIQPMVSDVDRLSAIRIVQLERDLIEKKVAVACLITRKNRLELMLDDARRALATPGLAPKKQNALERLMPALEAELEEKARAFEAAKLYVRDMDEVLRLDRTVLTALYGLY